MSGSGREIENGAQFGLSPRISPENLPVNRPSPAHQSNNRASSTPVEPIDRVRRVLIIALIISSIFVFVFVAIVLIVAYATSNTATTSALVMPYNVQSRSLPDTTNVGADLPHSVGRFNQTALSGNLNRATGTINGKYTSGTDTVQITIDLNANNAQALTNFKRRLGTFTQSNIDTAQDLGVGYARAVDPKTHAARLVYLKQFWIIDVTASSQAALDAFMTAYSY